MRIAALTDIHAVSSTLEQALSAARREGFDVLLLMGDLLTYGVAPLETVALVQDAVARDGASTSGDPGRTSGRRDAMSKPV